MAAYFAAATSGVLDKATVIDALIRGDWLTEDADVDDILDAAEEEVAQKQEHDLALAEGQASVEVAKIKAMPPKASPAKRPPV